MRTYTVIIEKTADGYCASVPTLPGCVAMANTKAEVETLVYEAIRFHIEGLIEEHLPVPEEHETFIETMVIA